MSASSRVLICEDEPSVARALARIVRELGCEVEVAADVPQALACLTASRFDLVLTDMRMPGGDGSQVLAAARHLAPPPPVVVITAYASIPAAVQAMRQGARGFIAKPFQVHEIEDAVREALAGRTGAPAGQVIAEDPKSRAIFQLAAQIGPGDATVLCTGETGVGKEVVARTLHESSGRKGQFVGINCAAIPDALLESELFGHVKGAFTNAAGAYPGRFVLADKGTLLLDEIAEMSPHLQAKLLRAIQEREVWPIGGTTPTKVDVRIIATTHADLEQRVNEGRFRADLYWRLAVIPIRVPPLRERRGDIPPLAHRYLAEAAARRGDPPPTIAPRAMERLCGYAWPGNIRELANLCARLVALKPGGGTLDEEDLPEAVRQARRGSPAEQVDLRAELERLEWQLIDQALAATGGNREKAAKLLGMKRTTLVEKLKRRMRDTWADPLRSDSRPRLGTPDPVPER